MTARRVVACCLALGLTPSLLMAGLVVLMAAEDDRQRRAEQGEPTYFPRHRKAQR